MESILEFIGFFMNDLRMSELARLVVIWLVLPIIYTIVFITLNCILKKKKDGIYAGHSSSSSLILLTIFLMLSMFEFQYLSECYSVGVKSGEIPSAFEVLSSSFLHTLKSFGADDNFLTGMGDFRNLISLAFSQESSERIIGFYNVVAILFTVIAPLTSVTIVFEVLTNFIPKLRLYKSAFIRRKQYYFSELNECSLALAESIYNDEKNKKFFSRPCLVFANVNKSKENESLQGGIAKAKSIGAICLKDSLSSVKVFGKAKTLFLVDNNEKNNIKVLSELCGSGSKRMLKQAIIYVFYQDDSYVSLQNGIYKTHENKIDEELSLEIIRVKYYEKLIFSLLEQKPLVEPLMKNEIDIVNLKNNRQDYNLTILGDTEICRQMFLSSTWAGQFYGYKLNINIVNTETVDLFKNKIDKFSPELLSTTRAGDKLLKTYLEKTNNDYQEPYFSLRYGCYNLEDYDLSKIKCVNLNNSIDCFNILESNYIFVDVGSDEANIALAEELKRKMYGSTMFKVIVPIVNNNAFSKIVKVEEEKSNVEIFPFGNRDELYNYKNIVVNESTRSIQKEYAKFRPNGKGREFTKKNQKLNYDFMSSKAREIHFKYRVFSALLYKMVNRGNNAEFVINGFKYNSMVEQYEGILKGTADDDVMQYLTWLEHRRWNAYMRSIGFTYCDLEEKNIDMKIHRCLVECSKKPLLANSKTRIDSLKGILIEGVESSSAKKENEFEEQIRNLIKSWIRFRNEEIDGKRLISAMKVSNSKLFELKKELNVLENKLKTLDYSKDDNKNTAEIVKENIKNQKEKIMQIISANVDEYVKSCDEDLKDMLDGVSLKNNRDMKYYDYPVDTDTEIIKRFYKKDNRGD